VRHPWRTKHYTLGESMQRSRLNIFILILVCIQTTLSLIFPIYKDTGWVKDTWFGNDLVTIIVFIPIFLLSILSKRTFGKITIMGCYGYLIYNYMFYLLGCSLNKLFVVYNLILILAVIALIRYLIEMQKEKVIQTYFNVQKRNYVAIIVYLFIGLGLGIVWIGKWFSYSYLGNNLPSEEPIFRLIASLDITFMITGFILSGIFIIKRKDYGYTIGAIIGLQGFLYLIVLSMNSVLISIKSNTFPGELPIWGTLLVIEGIGLISFYQNRIKAI
jgi:hypothetical protein